MVAVDHWYGYNRPIERNKGTEMTRKHFKAMAETIAAMSNREAALEMAVAFVKVAKVSNPRFNSTVFYAACNLSV